MWTHNGRSKVFDNPRLLTDRKAKKLASLLKCQRSALKGKERTPFINTLVFLSAKNVVNKLQGPARLQVCTRKNVLDELRHVDAHWTHKKLDRPTSKVVARALEEAGIKESLRSRRVGLYELNEMLDEADHFQDCKTEKLSDKGEDIVSRGMRSENLTPTAGLAALGLVDLPSKSAGARLMQGLRDYSIYCPNTPGSLLSPSVSRGRLVLLGKIRKAWADVCVRCEQARRFHSAVQAAVGTLPPKDGCDSNVKRLTRRREGAKKR